MEMKLLLTFIIFNIINVIIQTVKSIATIKCGKTVAALVNAVAYGLYTYIVVLTVCNLPLWVKMLTVGLANLVGVYVVKYFEEKGRKDKLWLVKMTIPISQADNVKLELKNVGIPFTPYHAEKYYVFDTFCETQAQTSIVQNICRNYKGKVFATENKLSL